MNCEPRDYCKIEEINGQRTITIQMGSGDEVILDKLFGSTIFADLRITAKIRSGPVAESECGWVIERRRIDSGEWVRQTIIPAQLEEEFKEE
jgi:hypothetical protein